MDVEFDIRQASAEALAYVRKESLDIFNRLHSIEEDVRFVEQVHEAYPDLPILRMSYLFMYPCAVCEHESVSQPTLWRVVCGPCDCEHPALRASTFRER